ncbi:hypothetical protein [Streptomyces sp. BH055]|uniref:hypothetical protein n=1 Tax=Streptomyces sp. BH055 TaxID=3401173 RepID=UPI003BB62509
MHGPDLPSPDEPMTTEAVLARWPTGVRKRELVHGVIYFYGAFDERDVDIAERAYPGRRALVNEADDLEVHPAGPGEPHSVLDLTDAEREARAQETTAELERNGIVVSEEARRKARDLIDRLRQDGDSSAPR